MQELKIKYCKDSLAGVFSALGLYAPTLSVIFFNYFDVILPSVVTALYMYVFAALGLLLCIAKNNFKPNKIKQIGMTLVVCLLILWAINILRDYIFGVSMSEYDYKRPLFFILAIAYSLLGIINFNNYTFLLYFLKTSGLTTIILSIFYLSRYDPTSVITRIDGDSGLMVGHLCVQGLGAIYALMHIKKIKYQTCFLITIIIMLAIMGSGTRSAIVSFVLIIFSYFIFGDRKSNIKIFTLILTVIIPTIIYFYDYIPVQYIDRLTNFKLEGSENRGALIMDALSSLIDNPFGKIIGYLGVYPSEIEWAHNVFVQMFVEIGLLGIPIFSVIIYYVVHGLFLILMKYNNINRGIFFFILPVLVSSVSAGDAYTPQFWFVLMIVLMLGLKGFVVNS